MANIIGVGYRDAAYVYDRLLGLEPPPSPNHHMRRGNAHEPLAAQRYAQRTDREMEKASFMRHPEMWWFGGTPDYYARESQADWEWGELGITEIKCPDPTTGKIQKIKSTGVPKKVYAQTQFYIWLHNEIHDDDIRWGSYILYDASRHDVWYQDFPRNDEFIEDMIRRCTAFWHDHVIARVRPEADDPKGLRVAMPPSIESTGVELVRNDEEWRRKLCQLRSVREEIKLLERKEKMVKDWLKDEMGDAEVVESVEGRVHFKPQTRRSTDLKALRQDHPEIDWSKYERETHFMRFTPYV